MVRVGNVSPDVRGFSGSGKGFDSCSTAREGVGRDLNVYYTAFCGCYPLLIDRVDNFKFSFFP